MKAGIVAAILAVAIVFGAWTAGALDTSTPQYGRVAAASITATGPTGATVLTLSGRRRLVVCTNDLNQDTVLTYNGANWIYLPSSTGVAVDLSASGLTLAADKIVGIYNLGSVPTDGSIGCTAH